MTQTVKIDSPEVDVKDKKGWGHPRPFIAIWDIDATVRTRSTSPDGIIPYGKTSKSHVIKYSGNYWGSKEMQLAGLESRPLAKFVRIDEEKVFEVNSEGEHTLDDNGEKIPTGEVIAAHDIWVDEFIVDMEHLQSKQVINSAQYVGEEETSRLIELAVLREFAR